MTLSRRRTLALLGGGIVLAAAAGTGATRYAARSPGEALAPWAAAGGYDDIRLRALSWALLAPKPHNRQPWVAELTGADTVRIWRDPALNLPVTDPFDRQLTIGMGCFLELMVLAAAEEGVGVTLTLFPEGEDPNLPIAEAVFDGTAEPDPLFADAPRRRSTKEPFDMDRPVAPETLARLVANGQVRRGATADPTEVTALRTLAHDAWQVEMRTPSALAESIDLMRIGASQINANPDGIDLNAALPVALNRIGLMPRESLKDPESTGFKQTEAMYAAIFEATPAFVWLATSGNTRRDQIAAGRAWLRLNLETTAEGLALHPVSQALQEYPEMAALYADAHTRLAGPGETVQMLGRLGYGPTVPETPRWPLAAKLRESADRQPA
ncbi:MAG: twin-arginine translocation pathway signal protein [Pseudomonadota bacterium]